MSAFSKVLKRYAIGVVLILLFAIGALTTKNFFTVKQTLFLPQTASARLTLYQTDETLLRTAARAIHRREIIQTIITITAMLSRMSPILNR